MRLDVRTIESADAQELYICATPEAEHDSPNEAKQMFAAVNDLVRSHGARVCRERVFVPDGRLKSFRSARHAAYPNTEPAIAADWLLAGGNGPLGGIQVHAVKGPNEWTPLRSDAGILGWTFKQNGRTWAVTGGLCVPEHLDGPAQAKAVFEAGEALIAQAGMDLGSVARTWIFFDDILQWYGPFNETRNRIFIRRGLLRPGQVDSEVPASTGIGVTPVCAARCSLEMFAVTGPDAGVKRYPAAGKQRPAYAYGSAFARASEARTPATRTVFVSGTAAIDEDGRTCYLNDAKGQIRMTMDCIMAVLRDTHNSSPDVVQAMAYCKTAEVAKAFRNTWAKEVPWPWVICIGDVCRDDLLFEAEVTACDKAKPLTMHA